MKYLVGFMFGVLFVLHYDFWWWDDPTMVLGFVPIGLAWHAGFSVSASLPWLLALKFAWPGDIERWAEQFVGGRQTARLYDPVRVFPRAF